MKEKTLELTMLFDFFGGLLTERQRDCFELYYCEDLSLAEIAENLSISRQGVRDHLVRAIASLWEIESKTGLSERFGKLREALAVAETLPENGDGRVQQLRQILRGALDYGV